MPETKKISSQKASALLRKEGKKTADLADGGEIITSEGVVLKEGGTYYLTTEPKPADPPRFDDPEVGITEPVEVVEAETFKTAEPEQPTTAPLSAKASRVAFTPRKADLGQETGLMKGGTRRRKSRLLKRALRRKSQGKVLTPTQIDILARHADSCRYAAAENRGF